MSDRIGETRVGSEELRARVAELGAEISRDYEGRDLVLVGVLRGAVLFVADLMRELTVPCETQAPITDLSAPSSAPLVPSGGSAVSPSTLPPALQGLIPPPPVSLPLKKEQQQTLTMVERALAGSGLKLHMSGTGKP